MDSALLTQHTTLIKSGPRKHKLNANEIVTPTPQMKETRSFPSLMSEEL